MIHKRVRGSGVLSKMASAAPESLTIQKQITESLWTSLCSGKKQEMGQYLVFALERQAPLRDNQSSWSLSA